MQQSETQNPQPQRPQILTVLCILSFIGSGFAGLSFLTIWASYDEIIPLLAESEQLLPGMEWFVLAGRNFYLTGFILYFFSLFGVSLMWRMRKAGFHFYTGAQVMLALLPIVYIEGFPVSILEWLVTAVFIILYARFYRSFT